MTDVSSLLVLADQCVKCGLCLPQCPTYTLSLNENESPRGRISLIQALVNGQLAMNESLYKHLDHCLLCRRCERVCPSQVKYGEIINQANKQIPVINKKVSLTGRLGLYFLSTYKKQMVLNRLLRFYQQAGLQSIVRSTGILKLLKLNELEQRLPVVSKPLPVSRTRSFAEKVVLFTGCAQTVFDREVISSALKILNAMNIEVVIPEQQGCCGALHQLEGQEPSWLINNNLSILKQTGIDTVLYLSTGCGAFIKDRYGCEISFIEITDYLSQNMDKIQSYNPLHKSVAVQIPCSQKNVLRQNDTTSLLLKNIPSIKLISLEQHGCCGAGGTTLLKYPEMADAIRQPLLSKVTKADCDILVTTNPGCQIHLQHGFKTEGSPVEVMHPVTLLAQQLAECD